MLNIIDFLLGWCCAYLSLPVLVAYIVLRFRDRIWKWVLTMDIDELIKTLDTSGDPDNLSTPLAGTAQQPPAPVGTTDEISQKREKLAIAVSGGKAERYLGRAISLDQVDKLSNTEVTRLYARYEQGLGSRMAQTLGRSILAMHSDLVARYEPDLDTSSLTAELEADPITEHGLSQLSCRLFYMLSWYLAPLSVALITIKHIRRAQVRRLALTSEDGGNRDEGEKSEEG